MYPCTNNRRDDIAKACKYHYKSELYGNRTIPILRDVIKYHNGCGHISDVDMIAVIMSDFRDIIDRESSASKLLMAVVDNERNEDLIAHLFGSYTKLDATQLVLKTLIDFITMLKADAFGGKLPPNCPHIENILL